LQSKNLLFNLKYVKKYKKLKNNFVTVFKFE
jgi:hypothetical protein